MERCSFCKACPDCGDAFQRKKEIVHKMIERIWPVVFHHDVKHILTCALCHEPDYVVKDDINGLIDMYRHMDGNHVKPGQIEYWPGLGN